MCRLSLPQLERLAMATKALSFDVGDYVVYPKHGVGRVVELQSTEIAGTRLDLYVLRFEKEKMTLRVPVNKADSVGMRKLSSDTTLKDALETLKGKPRVKRTMWSRRAQEYEAKINSGDLTSIAEVTRDLFRPDDAPEQVRSARQSFEAATSRVTRRATKAAELPPRRTTVSATFRRSRSRDPMTSRSVPAQTPRFPGVAAKSCSNGLLSRSRATSSSSIPKTTTAFSIGAGDI